MKTASQRNPMGQTGATVERIRLSVGRARRNRRRGILSGTLVIALIVLFAALGLALELGLIAHVQIQLQTACDAAALAGAAELLDEDTLRPGASADWSNDIERALEETVRYSAGNIAGGQPVAILPNPDNDPAGDFVLGWLDSTTDRQAAPELWPDAGRCNTLVIRAVRSRVRGNPVPLWFSPVVGLGSANVAAESVAALDQRVYGFRPQNGSVIPMVPLAALAQGSEKAWFEQSQTSPDPETNDRFTVDYQTGSVRQGPDGIPEIELSAPLGEEGLVDGNLAVIALDPEPKQQDRFRRQLEFGLRADDLVAQGGELALDLSGRSEAPGAVLTRDVVNQLGTSLLGVNRVWPLYGTRTQTKEGATVELRGFAAGRVVDAYVNDENEAVVLVQASTLVTRTALVRDLPPGEQLNPWIARLCLIR